MFPDTFNCRWTGLYWLRQSLRRPRRGSWKSDQHTMQGLKLKEGLCAEKPRRPAESRRVAHSAVFNN